MTTPKRKLRMLVHHQKSQSNTLNRRVKQRNQFWRVAGTALKIYKYRDLFLTILFINNRKGCFNHNQYQKNYLVRNNIKKNRNLRTIRSHNSQRIHWRQSQWNRIRRILINRLTIHMSEIRLKNNMMNKINQS